MDRRQAPKNTSFPVHLLRAKAAVTPRIPLFRRMQYNSYYVTNYFLNKDSSPPSHQILSNLIEHTDPYEEEQIIEIPRVKMSELTPDLFRKSTRCNIPFIIEGMLDGGRVLRWNVDYLDRFIGKMECPITIDKLYTRELSDEEYHQHNYLGTYREVFDDMRSGSTRLKYIAAASDALMNSPQLLTDLPVKLLKSHMGLRLILAQLFIGGKETGSPLHAASQRNLFLMADGVKEWTVAHPSVGPLLQARMGRKALYTYSPYGLDVMYDPQKFGDSMDIDLLKRVCFMRGRIFTGDALFNPPWWWHAVKNITTGSIGISTRWGGPTFFKESLLYSITHILTPGQLRLGLHLVRSGFVPEKLGRSFRLANRNTEKES